MSATPRAFLAKPPPTTRVGPATFPADAEPVFRRAIATLRFAKVPFLVGGAFAFNTYTGIWRETRDLDLFLKPEDRAHALAALADDAFETSIVQSQWLAKAWEDDVFLDLITRNANGLFPVTEAWFTRARPATLFEYPVHVIPLEELVLSKLLVGSRFRWDGADLLHLFHVQHDSIDWDRIADEVGEHAELLVAYLHMYRWAYPGWRARIPTDVLARFETRAKEIAERTQESFRGNLLDLASFRVDVADWGMPDPRARLLDSIARDEESS